MSATNHPQPDLLPHRILSVAEEELSRVVLDIHDGPVQYLYSALSLLAGVQADASEITERPDLAPRLAQVATLLESSLYEIKFFLGTFRPPEFRKRSLVSIIEGLVIQHEEWTGARVDLDAQPIPDEVALPVKMALYRIVQEALSNANRHAGVDRHLIKLWTQDGSICLEVSDNGRGFVPPDLEAQTGDEREEHIGLRGMRDRVVLLRGKFVIDTCLGCGTTIRVEVPMQV